MKQRAMFGPVRRIEHRRAVADAARQYVIDHRAVHALDVTRPLRRAASTRLERSEEHTSELQSLMRISYAVFCLKKKKKHTHQYPRSHVSYMTTVNARICTFNAT